MTNNDLVAGTIYKTKEYDKFTLDNSYNREVDDRHVKKIIKSINTYGDQGLVFPIVVDNNYRVTDGQHRFTARKQLGKAIYYIMDIELESRVLGGINDAMKKWAKTDFIEVMSDGEISKKVAEIVKEINWPPFTVTAAITALSVNVKNVLADDVTIKNKQLANLERKAPLFILYMKELLNKVTNITDCAREAGRTSYVEVICKLALKLSKFGVPVNEIPRGTYGEILAHLYSKGLIQ